MNKKIEIEQKRRIEQLETQLKIALSDYQNFKRDQERKLEFERQLIKCQTLRDVVEVADDIDMAMDNQNSEQSWRDGIALILEKFRKIISEMGAEVIPASEGEAFNSNIHEAVGIAHGGPDNTIAKILQNGYKVGDIIVRPVRVLVNKAAQPSKKSV